MSHYFARTKLAMEIAELDIQKFNHAVAEGWYDCAPRTSQGATRIFDTNDMVALIIFRRQLDVGASPRQAAQIACGLRMYLHHDAEADSALCVVPSMGSPEWHDPRTFDRNATHVSGLDIWEIREFRLRYIRQRIAFSLDQANRILGDD